MRSDTSAPAPFAAIAHIEDFRGGHMTMQARAKSARMTEQTPRYRHICGWCRRDLGVLWQGSQQHSYAICDSCKQIYFAALYEPAALAPAEQEPAAA
jgi:hypothetical protein